jgi:activating signal cointegrator complex subunit 1
MGFADREVEAAAGKYLEGLDLKALLLNGEGEGDGKGNDGMGRLSVDLRGLVAMQQPRKTSILYAEPEDGTGRLYPFAEALRDRFMGEGLLVEDRRALRLHATVVNTIYAKPRGRGGRGGKESGRNAERRAGEGVAEKSGHDGRALVGELVEEGKQASEHSTAQFEHQEGLRAEPKAVDRSEGHGPNAKSWMQFDASQLIDQYKGISWAENVRIDRVQICKMGAKKILNEQGEVEDEKYEVVFEKMI